MNANKQIKTGESGDGIEVINTIRPALKGAIEVNKEAYGLLLDAKEKLCNLVYAMKNDSEFPGMDDFTQMAEVANEVMNASHLLFNSK